jgi:hypothetical protein
LATFTDLDGRDWKIALDGPLVEAVRNELKLDLLGGESYRQLADDKLLLRKTLSILCLSQIQQSGITAEAFRESIKRNVFETSLTAIKQEQLDFFPSRDAEALELLAAQIEMEKTVTVEERKLLAAKMEKMADATILQIKMFLEDPATDERIAAAVQTRMERGLDQALIQLSSATSLPELLESHPTGTTSGD